MPTERPISDEEVIRTLTESGLTLDDYFLIEGDMPGFMNERGWQIALVIEDDDLAEACVQFLRNRGARVVAAGSGG